MISRRKMHLKNKSTLQVKIYQEEKNRFKSLNNNMSKICADLHKLKINMNH
jgi:hypothetical protein